MNKNRSKRAVIFDCDGVMFDSRRANINFYNHLLARFHLPPMDRKETDYVHMSTGRDSVAHIFRKTPHFEEADAYRRQMDYTPFIRDMVIAPGLKDLLVKLRPKFRLAVATNRSNTIQAVLEQNGLAGLFDMVVSSLDVKHPKPHPESLHKILDCFHIDPGLAVYVGDSPVDLHAAEAAGIPFIAYGNENLASRLRAGSMAELEKVLAGIEGRDPYLRKEAKSSLM